MRGSAYLLGLALTLTGLTGAGTNLTATYQPWLWCAAAGVFVLVVTSLTDKGARE